MTDDQRVAYLFSIFFLIIGTIWIYSNTAHQSKVAKTAARISALYPTPGVTSVEASTLQDMGITLKVSADQPFHLTMSHSDINICLYTWEALKAVGLTYADRLGNAYSISQVEAACNDVNQPDIDIFPLKAAINPSKDLPHG
ncbi:hypothetical protein HNP46_000427 [Pseudomonas nitritireducens]|uniref:Uncharacterized protein n=1 Tax=Pseudomonas nitroreducens TaxID=46680 RepID=A0A7W7KFQ3_PSENT|nr:hypothetical protein [Pseudomonas nitritireducens]MBB4861616.1 hypothetical protein [Pseudomonas nitritireducens]